MSDKNEVRQLTIYEILKKEIIMGQRKPGSVFEEKKFAEQMGVSRTPVREAVLQLAREGLLVIMPRRGTIVSNISMDDICQLYDMRRIMEPAVMEMVVKKMEKQKLEQWFQYFKQKKKPDNDDGEQMIPDICIEKADDIPDVDAVFHLFLAESTSNRFMIKQMQELMTLTQRIRNLSNVWQEKRYQQSIDEHMKIIEALLAGDVKKAKQAVLRHLDNSEEGYRLMVEEKYLSEIKVF